MTDVNAEKARAEAERRFPYGSIFTVGDYQTDIFREVFVDGAAWAALSASRDAEVAELRAEVAELRADLKGYGTHGALAYEREGRMTNLRLKIAALKERNEARGEVDSLRAALTAECKRSERFHVSLAEAQATIEKQANVAGHE